MKIFLGRFIIICWIRNTIIVDCLQNGTLKKVTEQIFSEDISSSKQDKKVDCVFPKNILTTGNFGEVLDKYVAVKIDQYFASFESTLDDNSTNISVFNSLNRNAFDIETGRGRKKRYIQYLQTMVLGAWMLGTVVLGLTIKTIAIVAANAFLAALFSIVISLVSAYGKDLKSFMGTITNPIAFNLPSTNVHQDAYANEDVNSLETNAKGQTIRDNIDRMLRKNAKSNDLVKMELF